MAGTIHSKTVPEWISQVYPHVSKLGTVLQKWCDELRTRQQAAPKVKKYGVAEVLHPPESLTSPNDSQEYKDLLEGTLIATNLQDGWVLPQRASLQHMSGIQELLDRAVEVLVRRPQRNMLSMGYRSTRATAQSSAQLLRVMGVECVFPNTLHLELGKESWNTVLSLIGDDLMLHLLLHHTIFVKLPKSNCYMQLSGPPLHDSIHMNTAAGTATLPKLIPRRSLFYSLISGKSGLPRTHPLNRLIRKSKDCDKSKERATDKTNKKNAAPPTSAEQLRLLILQPYNNDSRAGLKPISASMLLRTTKLLPLLEELLQRHKRCSYGRLLAKHCPLPAEFRRKLVSTGQNSKGRKHKDTVIDLTGELGTGCAPLDERVDMYTTQGGGMGDERMLHEMSMTPGFGFSTQAGDREVGSSRSIIPHATPHYQVSAYLRAVCCSVFPSDLLGGRHNQQELCNRLDTFVRLKRFETLSVREIKEGMKVRQFPWMGGGRCPPSDLAVRNEVLERFLNWAVSKFFAPLLRSAFYVTECEGAGGKTHYFRRPVWHAFAKAAAEDITGPGGRYEVHNTTTSINPATKANAFMNADTPLPRMRLLPKPSGMRAIVNMSRRRPWLPPQDTPAHNGTNNTTTTSNNNVADKPWLRCLTSANAALVPSFLALNYETATKPSLVGAGVKGFAEVQKKLRPFMRWFASQQQMRIDRNEDPAAMKIYFASCDIEHCFDTIDPQRLNEVLKHVLTQEEYLIRRHTTVHTVRSLGNKVCARPSRDACPIDEFTSFTERAMSLTAKTDRIKQHRNPKSKYCTDAEFDVQEKDDVIGSGCLRSAVLCDGVAHKIAKKEEIGAALRGHIFDHVVSIPFASARSSEDAAPKSNTDAREGVRSSKGTKKKGSAEQLFRQVQGIPQGSILSAQLCNLYYGYLEKHLLDGVLPPPAPHRHLLLRLVDDFLLITTHKDTAKKFLVAMHDRKRTGPFGVAVRPEKSLANFSVEARGLKVRLCGEDGKSFPWCGLVFDNKCEVRASFNTFCTTMSVSDAITVETAKTPGAGLQSRLLRFLALRWRPMLIDPCIVSRQTALRNTYESLVMVAARTVAHARRLPRGVAGNTAHIASVSCAAITFQAALVKQLRRGIGCDVATAQVRWLGRHAFSAVFNRHDVRKEFLCIKRLVWRSLKVLAKTKAAHNKGLEQLQGIVSHPDVIKLIRELRI